MVLLAPFVPHIAQEMWEMTGHDGAIAEYGWVKADANALVVNEYEVVVQVNGKVKDKISVSADASQDMMKKQALETDKIKALLDGKEVVKVIAIPKKLINIVIK